MVYLFKGKWCKCYKWGSCIDIESSVNWKRVWNRIECILFLGEKEGIRIYVCICLCMFKEILEGYILKYKY